MTQLEFETEKEKWIKRGEIKTYNMTELLTHDGNFFIEDDIGIIGHAVFYGVLSLKKVYVMVVYADIANIFCYKHVKALLYVLNVLISVYHSFRTMQMLFKDSEMPDAAQTDSV